MIRSCIRQAVRVFAGAALVACAVTAQAANITISASNCASYSVGAPDQNGNVTLTCVPANGTGPLTGCSIQGSAAGTIGSNDPLTAVCSGGAPATNWTWSGGSCANVTQQSCSANESGAGPVTYSVAIHNGAGADANPSLQVTWSSTPPAKPTGCSITPSPSSLPAGGGSVNLTAQCTGGGGVATWNWGGATYTTTSGNTASATITTNTTFTVGAQNAGGTTNAQTTVNVGGGGGGPISCSGYLGTSVLNATWPLTQNASIPMGPLDAGVVKFTTGSATGNGNITLSTSGNNAATTHDFTMSTQPCDFGPGIKRYIGAGALTFRMTVSSTPGNYPNLLPNTTYYINIRNNDATGCVSTNSTCDIFPVNLTGP